MFKSLIISIISINILIINLHSSELSLNLNDSTIDSEFIYSLNMNEDLETSFDIGGGIYYKKDNNDKNFIYKGRLGTSSRLSNMPDLKIGLGIKLLYIDEDSRKSETFIVSPLFFNIDWMIPTTFVMDLGVRGGISYSPTVLSFKDASSYLDTNIETYIRVIENSEIFIGYRLIDTKYQNNNNKNYFDNNFYLGAKFLF